MRKCLSDSGRCVLDAPTVHRAACRCHILRRDLELPRSQPIEKERKKRRNGKVRGERGVINTSRLWAGLGTGNGNGLGTRRREGKRDVAGY